MAQSIEATRLGPNRTGQLSAPDLAEQMNDSIEPVEPEGADASVLAETRVLYIREDEASHAALVRACIEQLGGDPTVQTPSADFIGVATAGFLQAASDPRTTL